ncbi:MAG: hypothetical protein AB1578_12445 [Thermodesulfobacteriota bacterium]
MRKNVLGDGCFMFLLVMGAIALIARAIGVAIIAVLVVVLSIIALVVTYKILQAIYHVFNPKAKAAYLDNKAKLAEESRRQQEQEKAEAEARKTREEADKLRMALEHQRHRDGDKQDTPYTYQIGKHGNESLAIRYGIANQEKKVREYWYYAKGGERKRNPDTDTIYYEPATTIRLQKTGRVGDNLYDVRLTDFRNRKAKAVIEVGTEYVKTFYPLEDRWFERHADLETTLKGNGSFTLKELATFHVQKVVGA